MQFKLLFLLAFTITVMLHAQTDSSRYRLSDEQLREVRAQLNSEIENLKRKQLKAEKQNTSNVDLANSFKNLNYSIGYLYNLDKNCKFDGHGLTLLMSGNVVGFETYIFHSENDASSEHIFPAEGTPSPLPSNYNAGKFVFNSPVLKETTFGCNLLLTLHRGEKSAFHVSTGFGLHSQTSKEYYRYYQVSGGNIDYIDPEKSRQIVKNSGIITIGLGGSYDIFDNFRLSGDVVLKGDKGSTANYSPLPRVVLSYRF